MSAQATPAEIPTLAGCREKQRRGMKHLADLDGAISEWVGLKTKPYQISGEFHRDRGEYVFVGQILKPLDDLLLWGVMFGDALHNFRSALDHLVWQLVLLNDEAPGNHNQFPICDTEASYLGVRREGQSSARDYRLRGVSDPHKELIDQMQPYQTVAPPRSIPALTALRKLSNHDKHRLVHLTVFAVDFKSTEDFDQILVANADAGERVGTKFEPLPADGEAEILVVQYACPGSDPQVSANGEPPLGIGFSESRARLEHFSQVGADIEGIINVFAPDFPQSGGVGSGVTAGTTRLNISESTAPQNRKDRRARERREHTHP